MRGLFSIDFLREFFLIKGVSLRLSILMGKPIMRGRLRS
jgi:hypothetical protein